MKKICFNNYSSSSNFNNKEIDINWIQWLIGFLDAEGNFQTFPKKRVRKDGSTLSRHIGYGIHIGLHLKEKILIENIRSKLGNIGTIYEYPSNKSEVHFAMNYMGNL